MMFLGALVVSMWQMGDPLQVGLTATLVYLVKIFAKIVFRENWNFRKISQIRVKSEMNLTNFAQFFMKNDEILSEIHIFHMDFT